MMRRPRDLLWFEILVAVGCPLRVLAVLLNPRVMGPHSDSLLPAWSHVATPLVFCSLALPVAWLASRWGNNVARWAFAIGSHILVVSFLLRVFAAHFAIEWALLMSGLTAGFDVAASWQLFRPKARSWFRGERDPAEIADVFA